MNGNLTGSDSDFSNTGREQFADALISVQISPEIPETERIYDCLLGSWDIIVTEYFQEGNIVHENGECYFERILEGRAIQDLWITPSRDKRNSSFTKCRNRYGSTLRIFHPLAQIWKIYWFNPVTGIRNELIARKEGNEIIQEGKDDTGNMIRWCFRKITATLFFWTGEISADEGKTWVTGAEVSGIRKRV